LASPYTCPTKQAFPSSAEAQLSKLALADWPKLTTGAGQAPRTPTGGCLKKRKYWVCDQHLLASAK